MTDETTVQRNVGTAREFLAALAGKDIETMINAMTPGVIYHNMPLDPVNGRDEFRAFWESLYKVVRAYRIVNNKLEGKGDCVYSERMEYFDMVPDGKHIKLPVAGVFDFDDAGQIIAWREYWDANTWTSQGGALLQ